MLIAVDGYNFIKQSPELRQLEQIELQKAREALIEQLARYKRLKGHAIIVVFDGWQAGGSAGHRGRGGEVLVDLNMGCGLGHTGVPARDRHVLCACRPLDSIRAVRPRED